MQKNILSNERGFTLIEIISVLVILGILASVAIPKYMDMQTEAKNKTTEAALGVAASEVSLRYAKAILENSSTISMAALKSVLDSSSTKLGDYEFSYATTTSGIAITAEEPSAKLGTPVTKTVLLE